MNRASRRTWPLWAVPAAAGLLLFTVDLLAAARVATQGAEAAYPDPSERADINTRLLEGPDLGLWLLSTVLPLSLLIGLVAVAAWRLRRTGGRPLVAVGVLTAVSVSLLLLAHQNTPLQMLVFCRRCDAGFYQPAPGPVWYEPVRVALLVLFGVALAAIALAYAARTTIDTTDSNPADLVRPGSARATTFAATIAIVVALLVLWINVLALTSGMSSSAPTSDQRYFDDAWGAQAYQTLGMLAVRFAVLVIGLAVLAVAVWRGRLRRPGLALLWGGFIGVFGILGAFLNALISNPLNWASPFAGPQQPTLDVPWYPPMLVALTLAGVTAQVVVLVSLLAPSNLAWLAAPRQIADNTVNDIAEDTVGDEEEDLDAGVR